MLSYCLNISSNVVNIVCLTTSLYCSSMLDTVFCPLYLLVQITTSSLFFKPITRLILEVKTGRRTLMLPLMYAVHCKKV